VPPALLAMVVLLQSYLGTSDAEAVELAVVDLRWQMVLGCLGATEPPFSQGALPAFRERLIAHEMDRRMLERTIELARSTKEFDWKKLPKSLRVAIDSAPLEGTGRVEDTLNLLAHAARKVVECAADLLHWTPERVCREARAPLLLAPSIKAALDRDWSAGSGRTVTIAPDERLQQRLRKYLATPNGRARLRERVAVEHKLAHLVRRQGRRARYRGVRKNLFDLRRASAIQNLEAIQRKVA
jgi:hypothetical protein